MIHRSKIHFALLTTQRGEILEVLRDDGGVVSDSKTHIRQLTVDHEKLKLFYREMNYHGAAVNWEMKLKMSSEPLRFYGGKIGDKIVVLCAGENVNLLEYINELVGINSVQTNTIRNQSKKMIRKKQSGNDSLNKLSELNNSLVNLQRKLVKKNEALMRLTYQMNTVFDSAKLGFVFLKTDGKIENFNDAGRDFLYRLTGRWFDTGMRIHDTDSEPENEQEVALFSGILQDKEISEDIFLKGWFEVHTSPVLDEEGNKKGILLISEEISRRKEYEKTIESQKEFLYLTNKVLRHDLLNVFTVTRSATSLYKRTSDESMLESIIDASERGVKIIDRMRNAERILHDPEKLDIVRVDKVIHTVMKDFKELDYDCQGTGSIYGDELLYSLLQNLVANAVRHGKATKIFFQIAVHESTVVLKVANNGKPIPEEFRRKVFEENFKYGKMAHTGLGLYIVQKTTDRYGGTVSIETCEEWPVCFVLTFPSPEKAGTKS